MHSSMPNLAGSYGRGSKSYHAKRRKATTKELRCFRCGILGAVPSYPASGPPSFNLCDVCRPADWTVVQATARVQRQARSPWVDA